MTSLLASASASASSVPPETIEHANEEEEGKQASEEGGTAHAHAHAPARAPAASPVLPSAAEIRACAVSSWYTEYPALREETVKSIIIPLPDDFLRYLSSDGVVMPKVPEGVTLHPRDPRSRDDGDIPSDWSDDDESKDDDNDDCDVEQGEQEDDDNDDDDEKKKIETKTGAFRNLRKKLVMR